MKRIIAFVLFLVFGQGAVFAGDDAARAGLLRSLSPEDMIIYRPAQTKAVVTIFTDLGCPPCKKLHANTEQLMNLGIELRYLGYPRQKVGSSAYNKMVSIWCSKDRKEAMARAMEGGAIGSMTCHHPLEEQKMLGRKFGIRGTPTIIFSDGTLHSGYMSPKQLAREAVKHSKE